MTTFVDYAWWQVSPQQLRGMGFSGAMRYCNRGNSKSATPSEVTNLRLADMDLGLVFESTASRAAQGFQAGVDDAVSANAYADYLGYPSACTMFYAVDFDGSPAQVQPYFDGVMSIGRRLCAPYGSARIITGVRYNAPFGWQTVAWSGHLVSAKAGLLQNGFHETYDSNLVLVPNFGQWQAHPVPTPIPGFNKPLLISQEEVPMRAQLRPTKFNGHPVYDIYVIKEGEQAPLPTADGRKVTLVRSELQITSIDPQDSQIQIVAKGTDLGISGVPATGGQFKCTDTGLVSVIVNTDNDLYVDWDHIWA